MAKKKSGAPAGATQKNFSTGAAHVRNFDAWCNQNGYDPKRVFHAGTLILLRMKHEERAKYFAEVAAWEAAGFPFPGIVEVGKIGAGSGSPVKTQDQPRESKAT